MTAEPERTQALLAARKRDSDAKHAAVLREVRALVMAGVPVSIATVAKRAGVSRQFIYTNPTLLAKAEAARETQRDLGVKGLRSSANTAVTEAGLRTDLLLAQQEIARLRASNDQLRIQLRADLGARLDTRDDTRIVEQLVAKTRDLERVVDEWNTLLDRIGELDRRHQVVTEELVAERRAHAATVRALTANENVVPLR